MPLSMMGCGGVIVGDAEGDEGMGEGGAGVRMVESREALSCAIELKWNLLIHPSVSSFKSPGYQAQAQAYPNDAWYRATKEQKS